MTAKVYDDEQVLAYVPLPWKSGGLMVTAANGKEVLHQGTGLDRGDSDMHAEVARFITQTVNSHAKLYDTLVELVHQLRLSNAVDNHGHQIANLKALKDAEQLLTETRPARPPDYVPLARMLPMSEFGGPIDDGRDEPGWDYATQKTVDGEYYRFAIRRKPIPSR